MHACAREGPWAVKTAASGGAEPGFRARGGADAACEGEALALRWKDGCDGVYRQRGEVGVIHGRNGARTELHLQTTAGEPTRVVFPKVMGQQAHETAFPQVVGHSAVTA